MPTTLSTHRTASTARSALHTLLGTEYAVIAHETYRLASGRVLGLRLGNDWEIVELTAIEARHREIGALSNRAEELDAKAADYEARAAASPVSRANNIRFAAKARRDAAECRARAEALCAVSVAA